ncbi:hypothetical protein EZS27_032852 [termite gut metagenome]|uniref:Uncharacterized protein n=1 Tax=termite gut metagenome TaxID=433724 RepID=A0A5J4Q7D5_9ZZZZ
MPVAVGMVQGKQSSCVWTHGVSNFTLETLSLENQYGRMTGESLKSMFNFIELTGGSKQRRDIICFQRSKFMFRVSRNLALRGKLSRWSPFKIQNV